MWFDNQEAEDPREAGELEMSVQFSVSCGACSACEEYIPADTKPNAARWLRKQGWRLTDADGWICSAHKRRR